MDKKVVEVITQPKKRYFKFMIPGLRHFGFDYQMGLNADIHPFSTDNNEGDGGLYMATYPSIFRYSKYGEYIGVFTIPDDAKFHKCRISNMYKADKIYLEQLLKTPTEIWNYFSSNGYQLGETLMIYMYSKDIEFFKSDILRNHPISSNMAKIIVDNDDSNIIRYILDNNLPIPNNVVLLYLQKKNYVMVNYLLSEKVSINYRNLFSFLGDQDLTDTNSGIGSFLKCLGDYIFRTNQSSNSRIITFMYRLIFSTTEDVIIHYINLGYVPNVKLITEYVKSGRSNILDAIREKYPAIWKDYQTTQDVHSKELLHPVTDC